jgi:hypothetical protein
MEKLVTEANQLLKQPSKEEMDELSKKLDALEIPESQRFTRSNSQKSATATLLPDIDSFADKKEGTNTVPSKDPTSSTASILGETLSVRKQMI